MIPLLLKLRLPRPGKKPINLYLPIFWVWPLLFLVFLAFSPLALLAAALGWHQGYGRPILMMAPMVLNTLWHLHGLVVDVETQDTTLCIALI